MRDLSLHEVFRLHKAKPLARKPTLRFQKQNWNPREVPLREIPVRPPGDAAQDHTTRRTTWVWRQRWWQKHAPCGWRRSWPPRFGCITRCLKMASRARADVVLLEWPLDVASGVRAQNLAKLCIWHINKLWAIDISMFDIQGPNVSRKKKKQI
jgi:hypothetical protein